MKFSLIMVLLRTRMVASFPREEIYQEMYSEGYFEKLLPECFDEAELIEFRRVAGAVLSALA
eukprot:360255-Chlamydomonas_euryale.AAC.20